MPFFFCNNLRKKTISKKTLYGQCTYVIFTPVNKNAYEKTSSSWTPNPCKERVNGIKGGVRWLPENRIRILYS